jgi:hypothetical protein
MKTAPPQAPPGNTSSKNDAPVGENDSSHPGDPGLRFPPKPMTLHVTYAVAKRLHAFEIPLAM